MIFYSKSHEYFYMFLRSFSLYYSGGFPVTFEVYRRAYDAQRGRRLTEGYTGDG